MSFFTRIKEFFVGKPLTPAQEIVAVAPYKVEAKVEDDLTVVRASEAYAPAMTAPVVVAPAVVPAAPAPKRTKPRTKPKAVVEPAPVVVATPAPKAAVKSTKAPAPAVTKAVKPAPKAPAKPAVIRATRRR